MHWFIVQAHHQHQQRFCCDSTISSLSHLPFSLLSLPVLMQHWLANVRVMTVCVVRIYNIIYLLEVLFIYLIYSWQYPTRIRTINRSFFPIHLLSTLKSYAAYNKEIFNRIIYRFFYTLGLVQTCRKYVAHVYARSLKMGIPLIRIYFFLII